MPTSKIAGWKGDGKKVLISISGRSGIWTNIFASEAN